MRATRDAEVRPCITGRQGWKFWTLHTNPVQKLRLAPWCYCTAKQLSIYIMVTKRKQSFSSFAENISLLLHKKKSYSFSQNIYAFRKLLQSSVKLADGGLPVSLKQDLNCDRVVTLHANKKLTSSPTCSSGKCCK